MLICQSCQASYQALQLSLPAISHVCSICKQTAHAFCNRSAHASASKHILHHRPCKFVVSIETPFSFSRIQSEKKHTCLSEHFGINQQAASV